MKALQTIQELTISRAIGLTPQMLRQYSEAEQQAIKTELVRYSLSKNEKIPQEVILSWLQDFSELNLDPAEVIKRIRLAKLEKKFGASELATFINVDTADYFKHFKHEKRSTENWQGKTVIRKDTGGSYEVLADTGELIQISIDNEIETWDKNYFLIKN